MVTSTFDTVGGDLPLPLGGGSPGASGVLDPAFDVHVAGLSLNLHITKDTPYQRQTAEWRKEQVDQAPEAGEQTLSTWWLRSQMSFHGGAGIKYVDTVADPQSQTRIRFADSRGIDVWTEGEIKRLPDTTLIAGVSPTTYVFATTVNSVSYIVYGSGSTLAAYKPDTSSTITYTVTGMAGVIKSLVIDGSHYYVATSDGKIFKGPIDNSGAGVAIWNFSSSSDVTLGWTKQRLMAGIDNNVYELSGTGPALPTPLFTHPAAGWRWSAWCDSPDGVLGAGANGLVSAIFGFTLSDASGVPTLSPGVAMAEMPVGEIVQCMYFYIGSRLAIGTSAGLRVGNFDGFYGTFSYGPLSIDSVGPVTALTGRGAFVYAGAQVDGEGLLLRCDLGTAVDDGPIYAWATDIRTPTGASGRVTDVTVDSAGRLVFAVAGSGVYREATTHVNRTAWLRTGRLRFTTVEPKQFKYGRVRTEGDGTLAVSVASPIEDDRTVYTINTLAESDRFGLTNAAAEWIELTFTLTGSGKLTSYQVLALPAQPRQRLFALPVQVFDMEKNRHGMNVGYIGRAKELLSTLERIESSGDEVTVQCPVLGIDAVRCTVERVEFTQANNPTSNRALDLGGYANLVLRTST